MGNTTTILVSNDQLGAIRNNPNFGQELVDAIGMYQTSLADRNQAPTGTKIIGMDHNDAVSLFLVNGGIGRLVAIYGDRDARIVSEEDQIIALKRLVANLGFKLIKAPKKRRRRK